MIRPSVRISPAFNGYVFAEVDSIDKYSEAIKNNKKLADKVREKPFSVGFSKNKANIKYFDTSRIADCLVIKQKLNSLRKRPFESLSNFVERALKYIIKNEKQLEVEAKKIHKKKWGY